MAVKKPKSPLLNLEYDWRALRVPLAECCSEMPSVILQTLGITSLDSGLGSFAKSGQDFAFGQSAW
jgi:hypothetical protein